MVQIQPKNYFDCSIENNESMLNQQIIQEILHQSHESFKLTQQSFRLALIMSGASAVVSLIGVGLLFTHNASEGAIATASGLISGTSFFQLAREASEQQEKVNERLEKFAEAINQEK
ncbi:TRADD-N-associated membrane domain-containing protein [Floridanema evergladense]|uniref:Cyanobacterial TRADD-N associated 2 transmembrane domain-containing protein n=1 Tax=Floridaenema evergladense BLCC-F167 TaxID=3153639 RepID=A0ABV4WQV8_9CYAN